MLVDMSLSQASDCAGLRDYLPQPLDLKISCTHTKSPLLAELRGGGDVQEEGKGAGGMQARAEGSHTWSRFTPRARHVLEETEEEEEEEEEEAKRRAEVEGAHCHSSEHVEVIYDDVEKEGKELERILMVWF